uniref:Uncharacterized protein n=1 Tax=viral metagenome TaxID=1070528 RepID=A0A6M3J0C1_9ZZZZ
MTHYQALQLEKLTTEICGIAVNGIRPDQEFSGFSTRAGWDVGGRFLRDRLMVEFGWRMVLSMYWVGVQWERFSACGEGFRRRGYRACVGDPSLVAICAEIRRQLYGIVRGDEMDRMQSVWEETTRRQPHELWMPTSRRTPVQRRIYDAYLGHAPEPQQDTLHEALAWQEQRQARADEERAASAAEIKENGGSLSALIAEMEAEIAELKAEDDGWRPQAVALRKGEDVGR